MLWDIEMCLFLRYAPIRVQRTVSRYAPTVVCALRVQPAVTHCVRTAGMPGGIRTPDLSVRNAAFYPLNYGHTIKQRDYTILN